eukprot:6386928-Prymnesium_polylepis.1
MRNGPGEVHFEALLGPDLSVHLHKFRYTTPKAYSCTHPSSIVKYHQISSRKAHGHGPASVRESSVEWSRMRQPCSKRFQPSKPLENFIITTV